MIALIAKMSTKPGARPEPLQGHPKYEKVKELNSGTFGFVQLCKDKTTNELVAIKFIERGDKVWLLLLLLAQCVLGWPPLGHLKQDSSCSAH